MHHNYINGLVYHTYSMLKIAEVCLANYPALNKDLLFSGILIHDIGKTIEIKLPKKLEFPKVPFTFLLKIASKVVSLCVYITERPKGADTNEKKINRTFTGCSICCCRS